MLTMLMSILKTAKTLLRKILHMLRWFLERRSFRQGERFQVQILA